MAKLLLKFKDAVLKEVAIEKDVIIIGRKPNNDIPIDNLAVSSTHAKVIKDGGSYVVEDQNSLNGTFVNGKKITKQMLQNGDNIIIGKHVLTFVSVEEVQIPTTPVIHRHSDETLVLDPKLQQEMIKQYQSSAPAAAAANKKDAVGCFQVIEGSTDKKVYECWDRVSTIGKDDGCYIRLKGLFKPKVAALINRRQEGYFISPSGSGKPILVNGKEIPQKHQLRDGDIVDVEGVKMQFYLKD